MVSLTQNSFGVYCCKCRVRFNESPENNPKVPEKVWEVLVQSQVMFNRVPENVPEKVWEVLVQIQVKFNRASEKSSGEGMGGWYRARTNSIGFGIEPGQVQ